MDKILFADILSFMEISGEQVKARWAKDNSEAVKKVLFKMLKNAWYHYDDEAYNRIRQLIIS